MKPWQYATLGSIAGAGLSYAAYRRYSADIAPALDSILPTMPASVAADSFRLPISAAMLTPIRAQALSALKDILPAENNSKDSVLQAHANAIGPTGDLSSLKLPPGYSNCGQLPGYISNAIGLADGGTRFGTEGVRTFAKDRGCWVDAQPGLPVLFKPGDIYALSDTPRGMVRHVGLIVDFWKNPDGSYSLQTADSGQGIFPNWRADYVTRPFDIDGPKSHDKATGKVRYLLGWADIDCWNKGVKKP